MDLQSFSVNEFVDRSKLSRMDDLSSLSGSIQVGGGINKFGKNSRPGDQSLDTDNFMVDY